MDKDSFIQQFMAAYMAAKAIKETEDEWFRRNRCIHKPPVGFLSEHAESGLILAETAWKATLARYERELSRK